MRGEIEFSSFLTIPNLEYSDDFIFIFNISFLIEKYKKYHLFDSENQIIINDVKTLQNQMSRMFHFHGENTRSTSSRVIVMISHELFICNFRNLLLCFQV